MRFADAQSHIDYDYDSSGMQANYSHGCVPWPTPTTLLRVGARCFRMDVSWNLAVQPNISHNYAWLTDSTYRYTALWTLPNHLIVISDTNLYRGYSQRQTPPTVE